MEKHKLLTLNGEYVKLYVTTNSTLPRLLKNSGSLVVYHDLYFNKYAGYRNISFSYKDQVEKEVQIDENTANDIPQNILFADLFKNYINKVVNPVNNYKNSYNSYIGHIDNNSIAQIQYSRYNDLYNNSGNYLYLGNELIAGGWGFDNETQKNLAIQHLTIIPQYLNQFGNILNYEINLRDAEDTEIRDRFKKYIKKNSDLGSTEDPEDEGDGNNAWLSSLYFPGHENDENEHEIYLKDIPFILEKAQYDDLKINRITHNCRVSFLNISNSNNSSSNIVSNYFIGDDEGLTYKDEEHNILYVPLGSSLTNYKIDILYNKKDSGGIIGVQYKQLINKSTNENTNTSESIIYSDNIIEEGEEINKNESLNNIYVDSLDDTIDYDELVYQNNVDEESEYLFNKYWLYRHNINPNVEEEENLDNIDNDNSYNDISNFVKFDIYNQVYYPFKDYKLIIEKTPHDKNHLKYYPIIVSQMNDTSSNEMSSLRYLRSIENTIKKHTIDVDVMKIIPKYLIYGINPIQINNTSYIPNVFDIGFINGNKNIDIAKIIVDNKVILKISLNRLNQSKDFLFTFAIPIIYDINKITLRSENNMWEREITGIFKIISKYNISLNPKKINLDTVAQYNLIYGIYRYNGPTNNNSANILVEFDLFENNNTSNGNGIIDSNKTNLLEYNIFRNNTEILDTDSFNGSHWLDYSFNNNFLIKCISKYCKSKHFNENTYIGYIDSYKEKIKSIFS